MYISIHSWNIHTSPTAMYLYIHGTWLFLLYNIIINKMKIIMKTSYNPTKSIVETMNEARENFKKRYGRLLNPSSNLYGYNLQHDSIHQLNQ